MEGKSLKQKILDHLQSNYPNWHNGGEIEDFIRKTEGRKASNASRRCRELFNECKIEREIRKGTVWYRFNQLQIVTISARNFEKVEWKIDKQMSFL